MWKRFDIFLAVLLLATAGIAHAVPASWGSVVAALRTAAVGPNDIDIIVTQATRHRVDPIAVAGWAEALVRMQKDGLPVSPGVDRVQQGLAKNISVASIDQALAVLHKELAWGKKLVDTRLPDKGGDTPDLVSRKAGIIENLEVARRQGFNMSDVDSLLTDTRLDIRAASRIVEELTAWSAYGLKTDFVLSSIQETLEADKSMASLAQLDQLVENYVAMGASTETITRAVEQKVMHIMRGPDMLHLPGGMMSPELGIQTPLLDLQGGAGINDTFISPTGDITGITPGSGGGGTGTGTGTGTGSGTGSGGMWVPGGHHAHH